MNVQGNRTELQQKQFYQRSWLWLPECSSFNVNFWALSCHPASWSFLSKKLRNIFHFNSPPGKFMWSSNPSKVNNGNKHFLQFSILFLIFLWDQWHLNKVIYLSRLAGSCMKCSINIFESLNIWRMFVTNNYVNIKITLHENIKTS